VEALEHFAPGFLLRFHHGVGFSLLLLPRQKMEETVRDMTRRCSDGGIPWRPSLPEVKPLQNGRMDVTNGQGG
jgi:hypothetical protein